MRDLIKNWLWLPSSIRSFGRLNGWCLESVLLRDICFTVSRDIREAIDCVLSGRPVTVPQMPRYNFCTASWKLSISRLCLYLTTECNQMLCLLGNVVSVVIEIPSLALLYLIRIISFLTRILFLDTIILSAKKVNFLLPRLIPCSSSREINKQYYPS